MKYWVLAFFFTILLIGSVVAIGIEKKLLLPISWVICFYMIASRFMMAGRYDVILTRVLTVTVLLVDFAVYLLSR